MKKERAASYHQPPLRRRKVRPHIRARAERTIIRLAIALGVLMSFFSLVMYL
jgi:hypothetical protein